MAVFKRHKLNDNGSAEYRQPGSTRTFRCKAGMWDGEAPMEIHITAPNLAPVATPKPATTKSAAAAQPKAAKGKKGHAK